MKAVTLFLIFIFTSKLLAQPTSVSPFIKVDQFGYLCDARKVAVISDPINGYNSAEAFTPGTGINNYEVRDWMTHAVMYQGTIQVWNGGATHGQSGDRGWYFDFTPVTESGKYYIYDVSNNVGSGQFFIGSNVYEANLKAVSRTYFYQRCNYAKNTPFASSEYTDAAAYEGSNQDKFARSSLDKTNPATARDVSGGWFDAGDMNKYVTFSCMPLLSLLDSYNRFPIVFGDDNNIPESGNGVADIMDEVKYELEWLKKMQNGSGTNGLLLKVGADTYSCTNSPPSADICSRYYIPECTSSTICGAVIFASAYKTFSGISGQTAFANDLLVRAENAFARAMVTTSNFTVFQTTCDNGDIKSGDADMDANTQLQYAVAAAVYLYSATNNATYLNFVTARYNTLNPMTSGWWGPYETEYSRSLLYFANLPGVSNGIKTAILNSKANTNTGMGLNEYTANTDLYRSHMPDPQYHWGSNQVKAYIGAQQIDFISYNLNTPDHDMYYELASQYLHYFHGVNPLGMTFLSNMYDLFGEKSANEIYHGWFGEGTQFDNALTSPYGPPPGYITGGANASFTIGSISPPAGQPVQKSYKDWNTGWNGSFNENSWEITEPSIYVQAAYINLLSSIIGTSDVGQCDAIILASHGIEFVAVQKNRSVELKWSPLDDALEYEVQRSSDGLIFNSIITKHHDNSLLYIAIDYPASQNDKLYYRIKMIKKDGSHQYTKIQIVQWSELFPVRVYQDNEIQVLHLMIDRKELAVPLSVSVLNMNGMPVFNNKYIHQEKIMISTKDWAAGYYIVQITKNDANPVIQKIYVQK